MPPTKTHVCENLGPQPETGANEVLTFLPHKGKKQCFLHLHKQNLNICSFSKYIRSKLLKFVSCPVSPDQQTSFVSLGLFFFVSLSGVFGGPTLSKLDIFLVGVIEVINAKRGFFLRKEREKKASQTTGRRGLLN